ncbi:hypothetical protein [Pseudonocardia sp. TRM90224]|uniref:hypothetical protein n=1 Tax=Pseudonocardia sp. TRM90224 TaxID=2812678 RepID=UPI001E403B19|nr:hypothetical protein [Pseudonocardia sp. TRM90224]
MKRRVELLSDSLLQLVVPKTEAAAASWWFVSCGCIRDVDNYRFRWWKLCWDGGCGICEQFEAC